MLLLLGVGFLLYNLLTYVLLLRDIRAILIMHNFYPTISDTLLNLRLQVLEKGLNSYPTLVFMLLAIGLFTGYFYLLREKLSKKTIFVSAVSLQLVVLFSWPILSTDIFYYILSDRVHTVYRQNVWQTPTQAFPDDPFFHLTDWRGQTKIYGPVNQLIYDVPSIIAGNDLFRALLVYKLLIVGFVIATLFLFLRQFPNSNSPGLMSVAVVFLNPLFIIETAGSGHNDILMLFFGVLASILFLKERFSFSAIALSLAAGVKIPVLALYPFLVGGLLGAKKVMSSFTFSLVFLITLVAILSTMHVSLSAFLTRTVYSTSLHWQSLPTALRSYLPEVENWWRFGLIIVLGLQGSRLVFQKVNPFALLIQTFLIYLLFFVDSLWNWYAIWPLIFLPFAKSERLNRTVMVFTLTCLLAYAFFWLSLRFNYTDPIWTVIIYGLIALPPIGICAYDYLVKKE